MARPKKTIPTIYRNIGLPADLVEKMDQELHSEVEGRIPFGAQQRFFTKLLRDYFDQSETEAETPAPIIAEV